MSLNTYSTDLEDSSSQYWSITDGAQTGLDFTGDFTLEFWIKPESLTTGHNVMMKGDAGTGGVWYAAYVQNDGSVVLGTDNGTTAKVVTSAASLITTGTWYHIACVRNGAGGEIFIDGSSVKTGTVQSSSMATSNPFFIGARNSSGPDRYVDGMVDECRAWSVARTGTEISDNMSVQLTGSETNLEGYWRFNNDGTDETSNGNDLTNNNTATFTADVPFTGATGDGGAVFAGCAF
uniref:Hemolysin-type calcium-binding toxin n=1 Tax=uncultured marine virus TaxID=186617 RepID=A0A0F7L4I5_9VIRU|nr:Hemolysin-type calcium-binding toxin [uncultured marine virus]